MTDFLFDLEGTLISGKSFEPLSGVRETIDRLNTQGHSLAVLTNNTTHAPSRIHELLVRAIGESAKSLNIVSPVAILEARIKRDHSRVLVIGSELVKTTITSNGGTCVKDENCDIVVIGGGGNADEVILSVAVRAILDHHAQLIALHKNKLYVDELGRRTFGVGGLASGLEYCCDVEATVLGKPSNLMYESALSALPGNHEEVVMVSDDYHSDLAGAKALGFATVFVATGKYSVKDLYSSGVTVDGVCETLDRFWETPLVSIKR